MWYFFAQARRSSDLTRFPFAVLELKLALAEADDLPVRLRPVLACVETNQCGGCTRHPSLSWLAMTRPSWLGRAARNRHRHAVEQASRRWRGGRTSTP